MLRREEGGCSREIPRSKAEISGSNHFLNTQMNGLYLLLLQYHIYASIALLLRLRGSREGGLAQIFFAAQHQCMIMEKMMPLLMWMGSRRHELTPPFLLASVPTIFSCSLFRNISLKADMPRGMGRTHQFQHSTPWKMQWIFRQMTICYWFLVPAAPSLGFQFLEVIMHWFFGLANTCL